jgi:hypothetical protein
MHDPIGVGVKDSITGIGVKVEPAVNFNTPLVGLKSFWELSDRWLGSISFNYGGFGGVSNVEETYDFIALVGYRFTMRDVESRVFGGYRYLHIELESRELDLEVSAKGPLLSVPQKKK